MAGAEAGGGSGGLVEVLVDTHAAAKAAELLKLDALRSLKIIRACGKKEKTMTYKLNDQEKKGKEEEKE